MIQVALTAKEEIVLGGSIEPYRNLCRSTELQDEQFSFSPIILYLIDTVLHFMKPKSKCMF